MHLILTGATGLVGSCVLDAMLKTKEVTKISILSRRPVQMAEDAKDPRVNVIIHKDFEAYQSDVLDQLKGANGCVWALGTAQSQASRPEYTRITKTFALAAAEAFSSTLAKESETPFNFVYVAGGGTTTKPGLTTMFQGRIKGEAEIGLSELRKANPSFQACSVRPFAVDMSTHLAIKPYVGPRPWVHRAGDVLFSGIIRSHVKDYWAPTQQLGEFLTELAMGKHQEQARQPDLGNETLGDFIIWSNAALRKIKGY
ncbi:hypothetical protein GQ53DRAFT_718314 [Thozetella sp. PMI_491]|nr:hypothetical protein GQ53DRAFT_718314 [Thozetella sp. PMI_491]